MANFTVTATDASGHTASATGTITTTGGAKVSVVVGETLLLNGDSGNAGQLMWQKITLPYPGVLEWMEFHTDNAAGNLRYGFYAANGPQGRAGTLIVESPSFASVASSRNRKLMTSPLQPAASYWLAHEVSSNAMQFRSGAGGNLLHAARAFGPMPNPAPTTGILTDWDNSHFSFSASFLVDAALIPPPPVPTGFINTFVGTAANWSNPSLIDGKEWFNHHGGRAYSLTKLDDYTLRMEIRQGDPEAIDVGGERSEINSGFSYPSGQLIDVEFLFAMEAGATLDNPKPAWFSLLQIYGEVGTTAVRPASINMDGERMGLDINFDAGTFATLWRDASPIVRGRQYKMHLQITCGTSGIVKLWRDDVLVANFTGNVPGTNNFIKLGIYRGWNGLVAQTSAAKYSHIKVV